MKISEIQSHIDVNPDTVFRYKGNAVIVRGFEQFTHPYRMHAVTKVRVAYVAATGEIQKYEPLVMPAQIARKAYDTVADYVIASAAVLKARVEADAKRAADIAALSTMLGKEIRQALADRLGVSEGDVSVRYDTVVITIGGTKAAEIVKEYVAKSSVAA